MGRAAIGAESSLQRRMIPTPTTIALVLSLGALIAAGCQDSYNLKLAVSALAGPVLFGALFKTFRTTDFSSPRFGNGTPKQLAWIRIIVCLAALIFTLIEDLPVTSSWPVEFRMNYQSIPLFNALPGYGILLSNPLLLALLQWTTAILLLLSLLGLGTRVALFLASLCFLVFQVILRQYTYGFHSGLVLIYLLLLLPWTPCAAAWSLDGKLNPAKRNVGRRSVAFSVYACLIVMALVYALCGLSKMRSGLEWFRPENLQHKMLSDAMNPIFLDYRWKPTVWLIQHDAPGFVYTLFGILGVAVELGYCTVLFSRTARIVMPVLAFAMHAVILIFQHLLFLDLLILQFVFVNADHLAAFAGRHFRLRPAKTGICIPSSQPEAARELRWSGPVSMAVLVAGYLIFWAFQLEYYPFSSWRMYASISKNTPVVYYKMVATLEDGRSIVVPRRDYSPAVMPNSLCILQKAFYNPWGRGSFDQFLASYVARRNRKPTFGSPISSVEIQLWRWNYAVDPHDLRFGWTLRVHDYDAVPKSNAGDSIRP